MGERAQLAADEREPGAAAAQEPQHRAEQVQPAQRVDVAAVRDREQRCTRRERRDRRRRKPVRDDRVVATSGEPRRELWSDARRAAQRGAILGGDGAREYLLWAVRR